MGVMAEILQGFDFDPLFVTTLANFAKLKTSFFFSDDPHL